MTLFNPIHILRLLGIRTRVLIVVVILAVAPVLAASTLIYTQASKQLEKDSYTRLTAIRELKGQQIERYFRMVFGQAREKAATPEIASALLAFRSAVDALRADGAPGDEVDQLLRRHYVNAYLPELNANRAEPRELRELWPGTGPARRLQAHALARRQGMEEELNPLGNGAGGQAYRQALARHDRLLTTYSDTFGYHDLLLVDHLSGTIVYSTAGEPDLGTSLLDGPYRDSSLAEVVWAAARASGPDVRLTDFRPYAPSLDRHALFAVTPVYDGTEKVGVLALKVPGDVIDEIMTSKGQWERVSQGATGETYLVGADYTLRSQSRFLVQDREAYLDQIRRIGLPEATVTQIERYGSSVGLQPAKTLGVQQAMAGQTGELRFKDYRGVEVLSAFGPLDISGVHWVIVSEIDAAEALGPVAALGTATRGFALTLASVALLIGFALYRSILGPLEQLTEDARLLAQGRLNHAVRHKGRDELEALAEHLESMRNRLQEQEEQLWKVKQTLAEAGDQGRRKPGATAD